MELKDVKKISFPKPSLDEWKEEVETSLKGKSVELLKSSTYEGITLDPLYTEAVGSATKAELPGFAPFTRGIAPVGYYEQPWHIVQPVSGITAKEANEKLRAALERGQNIIAYPAHLLAEGASVASLFQNIPVRDFPVFIDLKGKQKEWLPKFKAVAKEQHAQWTGVLAEDPITEWVVCGQLPKDTDQYFTKWAQTIRDYQQIGPDVKTILVNTPVFHNGGAHAIQELAYGLAVAVQYIAEGQKQGLSVRDITERIVFSFAVDSHFFMSIAKLRAARRLWTGIAEAFEEDPANFKMSIHAVTSEWSETLYDQHVNILRTTNQAFAASIGGIQYLQVHPFNHASGTVDDFSERIARNIHLILKEETNMTKVVDPAGGSWYVEQLTDELAEKAWAKFLEIDQAGGILESIKQGMLQADLEDVYQTRIQDAASRKVSIIGTNVYPNLADQVTTGSTTETQKSYMEVEDPLSITPINSRRLSSQFEQLRIQSEEYKQNEGIAPRIGLINLNDFTSYKHRADFIKGLVAAGGIETVESVGCKTTQEALNYLEDTDLSIYCLCGSDLDYADKAESFVKELKNHFPHIKLYVAGKQSGDLEDALLNAGVEDFITVRTNVVTIANELLLGIRGEQS